jgi:hypothetical protein
MHSLLSASCIRGVMNANEITFGHKSECVCASKQEQQKKLLNILCRAIIQRERERERSELKRSPMTIVNFSFYVLCTCVAVNSIRNHFVTSRLLYFNFHSFRRRKQSHRGKMLFSAERAGERETKESVLRHSSPPQFSSLRSHSASSPPLSLSLSIFICLPFHSEREQERERP